MNNKERKNNSIMVEICKGIISGSSAASICMPLDTIKIQNQVRVKSKSLLTAAKLIIKMDGIKGLWRGLLPCNIGAGIFYGVFFPTYKLCKSHMENMEINMHIKHGISSYIAGIIGSAWCNPMYVLQNRYQAQLIKKGGNAPKLCEMISGIYKTEGLLAFTYGLGMTLIKNVELAIQLPLYEKFKKYEYTNAHNINVLIAGFLAKSIASSIAFPLDTIRTLKRTNEKKLNILCIINSVCKKSGFMGYYKGYQAYFIRSIPMSALIFCINDMLSGWY